MQPESMTDAQAIIILALRRLDRAGVSATDPAYQGLCKLLYAVRARPEERGEYAETEVF